MLYRVLVTALLSASLLTVTGCGGENSTINTPDDGGQNQGSGGSVDDGGNNTDNGSGTGNNGGDSTDNGNNTDDGSNTGNGETSQISSIEIFPSSLTLATLESQQAVAVGVLNDGSTIGLTDTVSWSSSNQSIATISNAGVFNAVATTGSVNVTATYEGITKTITVENTGPSLPTEYTIFFKKPAGYNDAFIYVWNKGSTPTVEFFGGWPGMRMTSAPEYGADWYKAVINPNAHASDDGNIWYIFNSGDGASQSPDLFRNAQDGSIWWMTAGTGSTKGIDWDDVPPGGNSNQTATEFGRIKVIGTGTSITTLDNTSTDVADTELAVGTVLIATAPPAPIGSSFAGWSGDGAAFLINPTLPQSKLLVAVEGPITLQPLYSSSHVDLYAQGRAEYARSCAGCHGDEGEGAAPFPGVTWESVENRFGTLGSLAEYIEAEMPTGNPGSCAGTNQGDCAYEIAAMIFNNAWTADNGAQCNASSLADMVPLDRNLRLLTRTEFLNTVNDLFSVSFGSDIIESVPADGRSANFDSASFLLADKEKTLGYDIATETVAQQVIAQQGFYSLANCGQNAQCVVENFGEKVFRRPLTSAEISRYASLYSDLDNGETALRALLMSPQFLYRSELGVYNNSTGYYELTNYEIATWLSYTFLGTTPDDTLLAAAGSSSFNAATQAARLLNNARAETNFERFVRGWLIYDQYSFPLVQSQTLQESMVEETVRFVKNAVFNNGTYNELLTANYTYVNTELADFYGLPRPALEWQQMQYTGDNADRSGLLGHASFLASRTGSERTSPIKRGVYVRQVLLCQEFPTPVAADFNAEASDNDSTRDATSRHTDDPACQSCHQFIDGVGFGLEAFGMDGLHRDFEISPNGQRLSIDSTGEINSLNAPETVLEEGAGVQYSSVKQLGSLIADSSNGPACYARQFYRYAVGHKETYADECTINVFGEKFRNGQQTMKELMIEYTRTVNFGLRK